MSDKVELLPCPFCGIAAKLESNHDWHRIVVAHDEACIFLEPEVSMVPATDDQLSIVVADWNRRAAISQQLATAAAPDGWKLVPEQPSIAACIRGADASGGKIDGRSAANVYAAMLYASPAAPAPAAQEPIGEVYRIGEEARIRLIGDPHIIDGMNVYAAATAVEQSDTIPVSREDAEVIASFFETGGSIRLVDAGNRVAHKLRALLAGGGTV